MPSVTAWQRADWLFCSRAEMFLRLISRSESTAHPVGIREREGVDDVLQVVAKLEQPVEHHIGHAHRMQDGSFPETTRPPGPLVRLAD
jgi:hypothetical protein